jgi:hypothetical protein
MLAGKLGISDVDPEINIAQVFPVVEQNQHNFTQPEHCWCSPEIYQYVGLDGQVDFTTVEHRWIQ